MIAVKNIAACACSERAAGQFDAEYVLSPCTGVCRIDAASGCCQGCLRRLDEIAGWPGMTAAQRHAVLAQVAQRRAQAARAEGL
jgi:hypothetical protein